MGTIFMAIGLLLTGGGLLMLGYEVFMLGGLQSTTATIGPAAVASMGVWFNAHLGNGWSEWVQAVCDWPRVPVAIGVGLFMIALGWRFSHSRRNMN